MMKNNRNSNKNKTGFTLVEIAFALLVLGLGLMSILRCFPSGLRASLEAHNDAVTGLFADSVFSAFQTAAANWEGDDEFTLASLINNEDMDLDFDQIVGDVPAAASDGVWSEWSDKFDYPVGAGNSKLDKIRYRIKITKQADRLYEIALGAKAGESGGRERQFITEVFLVTPDFE